MFDIEELWIYACNGNIKKLKQKVVREELECLLEDNYQGACANYWLSNRHNLFAEVTGDADEMWIDIKLEIYDNDDDWIGDLIVVDTKDMSRESFEQAVTEIVKYYYGEN